MSFFIGKMIFFFFSFQFHKQMIQIIDEYIFEQKLNEIKRDKLKSNCFLISFNVRIIAKSFFTDIS